MRASDNDTPAVILSNGYAIAKVAKHSINGTDVNPGKPSEHIQLRKYSPPNWFSPEGVARKRRRIEAKGLPSFRNWRFITLTCDRSQFASPLDAYLRGKEWMRRFMLKARTLGLWSSSARWCWKLEFQADGWPHWHLLVERTRKMAVVELCMLSKAWGLGRVNVERCRNDEFAYSFKYAFKPVLQSEDGDEFEDATCLPAWFQDYYRPPQRTGKLGKDGLPIVRKPQTMARVRFWQTSPGFYENPPQSKPAKKPDKSLLPCPVREHVQRVENSVQVIARKGGGRYLKAGLVALSISWGAIAGQAAWHCIHGAGVVLSCSSFVAPVFVLERFTETTNKHKLWQLTKENRLSLQTAKNLRHQGQRLLRC